MSEGLIPQTGPKNKNFVETSGGKNDLGRLTKISLENKDMSKLIETY
jgi:hypothetical protein